MAFSSEGVCLMEGRIDRAGMAIEERSEPLGMYEMSGLQPICRCQKTSSRTCLRLICCTVVTSERGVTSFALPRGRLTGSSSHFQAHHKV